MGEGNVGEPFAIGATALNGLSPPLDQQPFVWTVVAGSLPAGLSLAPVPNSQVTTLIQGKPKQSGTSTFTLEVQDNVQRTAEQSFTITIGTGSLDSLNITGATYNSRRTTQLSISANDDNADAVLTAFVTATGKQIGTLHSTGAGGFTGAFAITPNPMNITVKSSRGASASSAVTVITRY
jgi:hypothetical protein